MRVWQGYSLETDARAAVAEAVLGWEVAAAPPDFLIAFTSTKQDPAQIAACLAERFPRTLVVGCTTAGEMIGDAHPAGSVVLTGVRSPTIRFSAAVARDLGALGDELLGALAVAHEAPASLTAPARAGINCPTHPDRLRDGPRSWPGPGAALRIVRLANAPWARRSGARPSVQRSRTDPRRHRTAAGRARGQAKSSPVASARWRFTSRLVARQWASNSSHVG